ncbi:MAG TPA: cyclic-phosphate processing receiver domain-containing protein [Tepidisphaeraceae bacterium]|nr:cyclic-phosphate processing receiver domain-containing protein [Tepidisphaeraceae bacterium]
MVELLPAIKLVFFDSAPAMISWLGQHLADVALISLDHDLPLRDVAGTSTDYGTGRQVADFLASVPPTCPVIVHSSNDRCATGMFFALKDAKWPCSRVYPCDDLAWIKSSWADQVRRNLSRSS